MSSIPRSTPIAARSTSSARGCMPSFESDRGRGSACLVRGTRQVLVSLVPLLISVVCPAHAEAQQTPPGFAVERFSPSAAGAGWFVMDDLDMDGGLGGAVAGT